MSADTSPLKFKEKLGYGLGDAASNILFQVFVIFLLYYYTDVYGLAPAAVGTMLLVTRIFDAVTDPAMGVIADRTQTRWGKFRPFILWAAIPYGVLGFAMFAGPDLGDTGKLIYAYITLHTGNARLHRDQRTLLGIARRYIAGISGAYEGRQLPLCLCVWYDLADCDFLYAVEEYAWRWR